MTPVHLAGCLGNGMAALARLYRGLGHAVTGCDVRAADPDARPAVDRLTRLGVAVGDQAACRPAPGTGLVVHTLAMPAGHPELAAARAAGIPVRPRVRALAELLPHVADTVIAVSGVTGKTTVAALVAGIHRELGRDPAVYIGGDVDGLTDRPHRPDAGRLAVVEACEVERGMLALPATVAAVTAVYWGEHPASYPTEASLAAAFGRFAGAAPRCVLPAAHRSLSAAGDVVTFGAEPDADVRLADYRPTTRGFTAGYDVAGTKLAAGTRLHGRHNAENLAAALACHVAAGTPVARLAAVDFTRLRPPRRRIEPLGRWRGTDFYDDFGHNPHQIRAAFQALREHRPEAAIAAYLRPSGLRRLHAFGTTAYADALETFARVRVAPARPTFEDTTAGSDFADRLCAELRARGVDAGVRASCAGVAAELAGAGVACLFSILPPAAALLRAGQLDGSRL